MVLFPLEFQVLDPNYPTRPQDLLNQQAAQAGIQVIDMLPVFQAACRAKPGGSCTHQDRYLFADTWMHPSRLGHKLAASELYQMITQLER